MRLTQRKHKPQDKPSSPFTPWNGCRQLSPRVRVSRACLEPSKSCCAHCSPHEAVTITERRFPRGRAVALDALCRTRSCNSCERVFGCRSHGPALTFCVPV